jgi:hypothetical protein
MSIEKGVIVGLGEVGASWFKVLSEFSDLDIRGTDIIKGDRERRIDKNGDGEMVLHACIPYIEGFEGVVSDYIKQYKPNLVIVNTSCRMGSTRKIYERTNVPMVHVPVRGVHPNIDKGIKTFVNAIGPINDLSAKLAEEYFDSLGIIHQTFKSPEESELAKILDTTYYGWNILFSKRIFELCEAKGLDFENVYKRFNESYNEGYLKLGKPNVIRPVLIPPQKFNKAIGIKDNKMNGHCIRTNLEILKTMDLPKFVKLFVEYAIDMDEKGE